LCEFFVELKNQYPSSLKLVLAGDPMVELPEHKDIVITGFLEESLKHAAIKGALALVQSSYFESFSIVLCEAWVQNRPALVQGACTVLRGQAMRSNGAIPYEGYAEFEQAVMMFLENPQLADEMGINGRIKMIDPSCKKLGSQGRFVVHIQMNLRQVFIIASRS
jgi:glycosyltransferase involved in cell wall biosynthesis